MITKPNIRVRFAPAPTGVMHLGNIRTALMNFLFAKQHHGTFVLRIEDTDTQRNFDPNARQIIEHLEWLGLDYDEGPNKGGPYAPYFQSQRTPLYQKSLEHLQAGNFIYRCFCTTQELEKKRERQIILKIAPRYDRTCLQLTNEQIEKLCADNVPFVWRVKLDHDAQVTINDLARGPVKFDLKNFSDFPLTRADNTFTFIFANFVDDMLMNITHVFRGEDHLSNTANQAALYHMFNFPLPTYYHLPILCNIQGQKLSKRDFGFSIIDLQKGGFLPAAIGNYLATLGGSFKQEIIPFAELAAQVSFEHLHAGGQIKYDETKLKWFNHHFIIATNPVILTEQCLPFIVSAFPAAHEVPPHKLTELIQLIKTEMHTLTDAAPLLSFFFHQPAVTLADFLAVTSPESLKKITAALPAMLTLLPNPEAFVASLKATAQANTIALKEMFCFIRLALTGSIKGLGIKELIMMLGLEETQTRLINAIQISNSDKL